MALVAAWLKLRPIPPRGAPFLGARLAALALPVGTACAQGDPGRPNGALPYPVRGLRPGHRPRCRRRAVAASWARSDPRRCASWPWPATARRWPSPALVPVFVTFDMPFFGQEILRPRCPPSSGATHRSSPRAACSSRCRSPSRVPNGADVAGKAVDDMHFKLAGAGLKTPNAKGVGPRARARPGSGPADHDRPDRGRERPAPGHRRLRWRPIRQALTSWRVTEVVIDRSEPRDPIYSSSLLTEVMGTAPRSTRTSAWVWPISPGGVTAPPALGASLLSLPAWPRLDQLQGVHQPRCHGRTAS